MNGFNLTLATLILFTGLGWAAKPALHFNEKSALLLPVCENENPIVAANSKIEMKGGLASLPKGMLVARQAHFSVQSRSVEGSLVKVQSFQSFVNSKLKSKPKVVCGSSELPFKTRFSMMGPTLINTDESSKEKNIFWQFQVLADSVTLSSWNIKSLALSSSADIEKTLASLGYETKIYQLKSKQYEIIYSQKKADDRRELSIIYDLD